MISMPGPFVLSLSKGEQRDFPQPVKVPIPDPTSPLVMPEIADKIRAWNELGHAKTSVKGS